MDNIFSLESLDDSEVKEKVIKNEVLDEERNINTENLGFVEDFLKEDNTLFKLDDTSKSDSEDEESSSLTYTANYLASRGLISKEDIDNGKFNSPEELDILVNESLNKKKFENLNDSQLRYLQSLESGLPFNEFEAIEGDIQKITEINKETLKENLQQRFDLIYASLLESGNNEENAKNIANTIMANEEASLEYAIDYKNKIHSKFLNYFEKLKDTAKENIKIKEDDAKNILERKKVVLKGIPLNENFNRRLLDRMFTGAGYNSKGEPLNAFDKWRNDNSLDAEIILNTLMIYTNDFKDLSKIKNLVETDIVKSSEKVLRRNFINDELDDLNNGKVTLI